MKENDVGRLLIFSMCRVKMTPDVIFLTPKNPESDWELGVGHWELREVRWQMVDAAGHGRGTEAIVDVDDGHAGRAGVQHAEHRRHPAEARAVADAGRYGDDRHADQAANHARKRAFHAGDGDEHAGPLQSILFAQETMQAGDADVVETINGVAHELRRDDGLFGDRQVGCAGARDEHLP